MTKKPTLTFFQSGKFDKWYWRLTAKNGRIVADGAEGYSSEGKARQGFRAAAKLAAQEVAALNAKKPKAKRRG